MKPSIGFAIACVASLSACGWWSASAGTSEPSGYVEVTSAPVNDIEVYPSTSYEGRTVYLYNDRWYYRDGSNWRYYRQEPQPLAQHRQRFQTQGPARHQEQRQPQHQQQQHEQQHEQQQHEHH